MKKYVLLTIASLTLMACPQDDDNPITEESIVGTWKFLESSTNGVIDDLDPCETEETLVFIADGDMSGEYYEEDVSGNCILEEAITGTWTNVGNLYTLNIGGESETEEITFENNTFFFEDTYTENGTTYTERYVYVRQ